MKPYRIVDIDAAEIDKPNSVSENHSSLLVGHPLYYIFVRIRLNSHCRIITFLVNAITIYIVQTLPL